MISSKVQCPSFYAALSQINLCAPLSLRDWSAKCNSRRNIGGRHSPELR